MWHYLHYLWGRRVALLLVVLLVSLAANAWQWWRVRSLPLRAQATAEAIAIIGPVAERYPEAARLVCSQ